MALAPLKVDERNSDSGSIGEVARASHHSSISSTSTPAIRLPNAERYVQPALEATVKPYTSDPKPTTASTPPRQSTPVLISLRLSGTHRIMSSNATRAIGTLTKKMARHD